MDATLGRRRRAIAGREGRRRVVAARGYSLPRVTTFLQDGVRI